MESDGYTYLGKECIPEMLKSILIFTSEQQRNRLAHRLGKMCVRVNDDREMVEVDKIMDIYIEEYIECKKKIMRNLTRKYSKVFENEQGIYSIDELASIIISS